MMPGQGGRPKEDRAIGALATYRGLLSNRPMMRLMTGEFVSGVGDWLYLVALLVVVYQESSDPLLLGVVGAARIIPYIVLSVPAGIIVDRYDRRLVLLVTDVARGLIMVAMTVVVVTDGPLLAIVGLAIFATCFSTFFHPAIGSYVPTLVRDERELGPANSMFATLNEFGFIIGPALAGIIIATFDLAWAFGLNAATFAVVAVILATLPASRPGAASPDGAGEDGEAAPVARVPLRESIRPIARPLAGILTLDTVAGFMFGGLSVLTVLLAVDRLGAGEEATGYLNAAVGVGGVLGALASGAVAMRLNLAPPMVIGAVMLGLGFVLLGFVTSVPPALLAMAIIAAGSLVADVVSVTIFQRLVPDELRGRVLGTMQMVGTFTYAAGALLLPVLVATVGAWIILPLGGLLIIGASVAAVALLGSNLRSAADPARDILVRVSRLPVLAGVPPVALEAAAGRLEPVEVAAGSVIIRQGDPADRWYVIESGSFAVDQVPEDGGEIRRLRVMGPDEVFGEIGLLKRSPRTATVTAETDGRLLALTGPEFLELVGSAIEVQARLTDRYAGAGTS